MYRIWRIHDSVKGPCLECSHKEAVSYNEDGWGIFWTVNTINGRRLTENCSQINYWFVDIDNGSKLKQMEYINSARLEPSMLVETKRGYHCYWRCKVDNLSTQVDNGALLDTWNAIQVDRLVPFFNADIRARDKVRLLRCPGYYHMKTPQDPYLIRIVKQKDVSYHVKEMMYWFPDANKKIEREKQKFQSSLTPSERKHDDVWNFAWELDCEKALGLLSGTSCVGNEHFSFTQNTNGTKQIYVNGKSSSCWIDQNKRIGSYDLGGPSIAQWLHWYGHSWRDTAEIIRKELMA